MATVKDTPLTEPTRREQVVDAARKVGHLSHEARMLKSCATDAVESRLYEARRAIRKATRDLDDARDEAAYRIKRQPIKAVGLAFGAGMAIGAVSAAVLWLASSCARPERDANARE